MQCSHIVWNAPHKKRRIPSKRAICCVCLLIIYCAAKKWNVSESATQKAHHRRCGSIWGSDAIHCYPNGRRWFRVRFSMMQRRGRKYITLWHNNAITFFVIGIIWAVDTWANARQPQLRRLFRTRQQNQLEMRFNLGNDTVFLPTPLAVSSLQGLSLPMTTNFLVKYCPKPIQVANGIQTTRPLSKRLAHEQKIDDRNTVKWRLSEFGKNKL